MLCDQAHLDKIGSNKKCASEEESWKWLEKLDINGHYNKPYVNIDNLRDLDDKSDTLDDIIKYQNKYLIRDSFSNIAKRGLIGFSYIKIKNSQIVTHDSRIGFYQNV